ncbi:KTSC domain-containing protein [Gallibacterium salpingitidis]|uniref:KTSC domain-containing protein n=1 Tax=Gallibacterium salpingitidis TaxID=505341 RepID=UPI002670894E|nr:KTSC domain-containing protein [Gallibacterium salpingitidis]WKS98497.1 KTSC domain-containing protein [Gallibacterium salpingitidis]
MQHIPVRSSNISSIAYDENQHILEIKFRSGAIYQYLGVPPERYKGLLAAYSKGGYVADFIKPYYRYRRVFS